MRKIMIWRFEILIFLIVSLVIIWSFLLISHILWYLSWKKYRVMPKISIKNREDRIINHTIKHILYPLKFLREFLMPIILLIVLEKRSIKIKIWGSIITIHKKLILINWNSFLFLSSLISIISNLFTYHKIIILWILPTCFRTWIRFNITFGFILILIWLIIVLIWLIALCVIKRPSPNHRLIKFRLN
jgi:hypothetical protein